MTFHSNEAASLLSLERELAITYHLAPQRSSTSPGCPMAAATSICRSAFAGLFERITAGANKAFGEVAVSQYVRRFLTRCPC